MCVDFRRAAYEVLAQSLGDEANLASRSVSIACFEWTVNGVHQHFGMP